MEGSCSFNETYVLYPHGLILLPLGNGHDVGCFKGSDFGQTRELCSYPFSSGGGKGNGHCVIHPVDVSIYVAQLFPEDFW